MADVTMPGLYHTAQSAHLEGIDFAGKTGTAQVVGHDSLSHIAKTHAAVPNVWFVGVTPRRNPELVVAVLWQNGGFSYYPARIGAQVVSAYVEKRRRLEHNLEEAAKPPAPVEVGAVWSVPPAGPVAKNDTQTAEAAQMRSGHFFVDHGKIVAANGSAGRSGASSSPVAPSRRAVSPSQAGTALPLGLLKGSGR